jgi:hypothetical protein
MTALKDILVDTNITFQPDGMRIINMDKSHTILVHLFLKSENFEVYECKKDKIIIDSYLKNNQIKGTAHFCQTFALIYYFGIEN